MSLVDDYGRCEADPELPFRPDPPHTGSVPHDRDSLHALRNLIEQADLILESAPALPQNRTPAARENLRAALAIADDLIGQAKRKGSPAAKLGHLGGSVTSQRHGPEHYRQMAAKRKTRAGGRPSKD